MSRLGNIKTKSGKSALPDDFAETLLKVFKTSSVAEFNALFMHFSIQTQLANFQNSSTTRPSVDLVLKFAEAQYRHLRSTNAWTGISTKANKTSFKACLSMNKGETICFNCGGAHSLKECPKPQNEDRIKTNKKLFGMRRRNVTPTLKMARGRNLRTRSLRRSLHC